MTDEYPLEIEEVYEYLGGEFGGVMGYRSLGHHPQEEFVAIVNEDFDHDHPVEAVKHEWCVDVEDEEGCVQYVPCKPETPGAYPVTYVGY